jgi:Zn-dependent protease with chaperone function
MKLLRTTLALALISCSSFSFAQQQQEFIYRQELKDLKINPHYKIIFNEDSNALLRAVNRDVEIYKHLTPLERLARFAFLALNVIVVTPQAMPKLYSYVSDLCLAHDVALPTIFLTIDEKGFFNAAAQKLLTSTGGIVIGQELLNKTTDAELEAVIAHEIGHIKHNHVNKMIAISLPTYIATVILLEKYYPYKGNMPYSLDFFLKSFVASNVSHFVMNSIVNKRFEKQADEFAYKVAGHGPGLIEFFEHLQDRTQAHEDDFDTVAQLLTESKSKLDPVDYIDLCMGYYLAKFGNSISNARRWIYYYTRYGAHPAPEARIAAAQAYLDEAANQ